MDELHSNSIYFKSVSLSGGLFVFSVKLFCTECAESFPSKHSFFQVEGMLMELCSALIVMKSSEMEHYEYFFHWCSGNEEISLKGIPFFSTGWTHSSWLRCLNICICYLLIRRTWFLTLKIISSLQKLICCHSGSPLQTKPSQKKIQYVMAAV